MSLPLPLDTALALIGFAFVMSISPGPGNFLLLASGVNFGFLRSAPLIFGISGGFLTMVLGIGLGLGQALQAAPSVAVGLKLACAAYVLWLAWRIGSSRSLGSGAARGMERPIRFIEAALLQLLNPKAWAVALIVTVSYTDPSNYLPSLLLVIGLFALVTLPAISVWALSGVALRRWIGEGRRLAIFNMAMAALLVVSMLPVLIGG